MLEVALTGQVLLWLIVLGFFLASGQASLFHPLTFYLFFHGMVFVVRPMLIHYLHFDTAWIYMKISPTDDGMLKTLAVTSCALLVFGIVCLTVGRTRTEYQTAAPAPFTRDQTNALALTTLLLAPLILYSIKTATGGGMQGEHRGGVFVLTGASGYTIEAQYMAGPLICAWLALTRFNWISLGVTALYIAYRSYTGWSRWTIILFFLAVSAVYAWQRRSRWLPLWSILLALPLLILFQTLGHNRSYVQNLLSGEQVVETTQPMTSAEAFKLKYDTQEFANFDFLYFILQVVPERTETFTYGTQYLQLFTEPIPRKLWPGKPAGAPIGFFNLNNYGDFLGLTPSLVGDGWMSGGWVGVIITVGLVGWLLGLAHRWFWRNAGNNFAALFYMIGIAMLPQWYRDGGISIAKFFFWNLSPLILWLGVSWLMGSRLVPAYSVRVPRNLRLHLVPARAASASRNGAGPDSQPR